MARQGLFVASRNDGLFRAFEFLAKAEDATDIIPGTDGNRPAYCFTSGKETVVGPSVPRLLDNLFGDDYDFRRCPGPQRPEAQARPDRSERYFA